MLDENKNNHLPSDQTQCIQNPKWGGDVAADTAARYSSHTGSCPPSPCSSRDRWRNICRGFPSPPSAQPSGRGLQLSPTGCPRNPETQAAPETQLAPGSKLFALPSTTPRCPRAFPHLPGGLVGIKSTPVAFSFSRKSAVPRTDAVANPNTSPWGSHTRLTTQPIQLGHRIWCYWQQSTEGQLLSSVLSSSIIQLERAQGRCSQKRACKETKHQLKWSLLFFSQVLENLVMHSKYTQRSLKHEAQNDTTKAHRAC